MGTETGDADTKAEQDEPRHSGQRSAAEWTTFALSVVVIAALVGAALYEYFGRGGAPGAVVAVAVAADRAERRDGQYYVPFRVANVGNDAAIDVAVRFRVLRGEETVEEATTLIAFLPVNGDADGELVTAHDPASHRITARVDTLLRP